jgi:rare lipoprotein A
MFPLTSALRAEDNRNRMAPVCFYVPNCASTISMPPLWGTAQWYWRYRYVPPSLSGGRIILKALLCIAIFMLGNVLLPSVSAAGQTGIASVYSTKHSTKTASGSRMMDHAMTAAHRTLPFGTKVRVTHAKSGKSVIVTITDRGPFVRGRIIDLTPAAARLLGVSALAPVMLEMAMTGRKL